MPIGSDPSGRRYVEAEVEVPGTPEEIWQAIATGPGVSGWFVPTRIDEREGGSVVSRFGPGMDSVATITHWEPPHRFVAESGDLGPEAPMLATEWTVEARADGACVVRVVHRLCADSDAWDSQLTDIESGWPTFFRVLRLYLAHFRGQRVATLQLAAAPGPRSQAWEVITGALGLSGTTAGEAWSTPYDAPPLAGVVQQWGEEANHQYGLLLLSEPAPGIASLIATTVGDQVYPQLTLHFYGERARAAARDDARWRAWFSRLF